MPGPQYSGVERVTVRSLAMMRQETPTTPPLRDGQIWNPSASLSNTEESSVVPAPEGKNEEAIWVVVIRGATVHSGPSVSAPAIRFYRVGTELNLIDYQQGWFQVSDPTTLQDGWIYEKYYLEAIRGPGQARAVIQDSPSPTRAALKVPKPRPPLRRVKKPEHQRHEKLQPHIASETVASLLEKPFGDSDLAPARIV
jgi:Bacterial SH3 domain